MMPLYPILVVSYQIHVKFMLSSSKILVSPHKKTPKLNGPNAHHSWCFSVSPIFNTLLMPSYRRSIKICTAGLKP